MRARLKSMSIIGLGLVGMVTARDADHNTPFVPVAPGFVAGATYPGSPLKASPTTGALTRLELDTQALENAIPTVDHTQQVPDHVVPNHNDVPKHAVTPEDAAIAKTLLLMQVINRMLAIREKSCIHIWLKSLWVVYDEIVKAAAEVRKLFVQDEPSFKDESTRMLFAELQDAIDIFHSYLTQHKSDLSSMKPIEIPVFDTNRKEWGGNALAQEAPILQTIAQTIRKINPNDYTLSVLKETASKYGVTIDLHIPLQDPEKKRTWGGWTQ